MIVVFSVLTILAVGYAQYRNGIFSSVGMLVAVVLAGVITYNFWEPLADQLEQFMRNGTLSGCEDLISFVVIFGMALFLLRLAMFNYLAPEMIDQHGKIQFLGAGAVGMLTGYLVAGFLTCVLQTLPLDERFLDFEPRSGSETPLRSFLPPDRVWLALMRHAGTSAFSWKEDPQSETSHDRYLTFDRFGTFELRYLRYRRNTASRPAMPYLGEFDRELYGRPKSR